MPLRKLTGADLESKCDPEVFPFKTTEDYEVEYEPSHQKRGVGSIDFGLHMKAEGYNLFVCGSAGTGRTRHVKNLVYEVASSDPTPDDWIYVYNFSHEDEPVAINLPAGTGRIFRKDMKEMVSDIKLAIGKAFESEDYERRKHDMMGDYKQKRDIVLQEVENTAEKEGFALKQTATGVILVPKVGDELMKPEEYEELSENEKTDIEAKKNELHVNIDQVLTEVRNLEKEAKLKLKDLEKEIVLFSVKHIVDDARLKYKAFSDIIQHLNKVQEDVLENIDAFRQDDQSQTNVLMQKPDIREQHFKKYEINLLVDHAFSEGAPVIIEQNPSYYNLIGKIEYRASFGAMTTDSTMIAPGALHKANGGYLILQAMDVLSSFMAWDALKRVLRNREIKVEDINEQYRMVTTTSLKPRSIPCDLKIIMIGPPWLYQALYKHDEDFRKMFKVKADFDVEMTRNDEMVTKYASFIKDRCENESLRHFERNAVARVVDYGSRISGDKEKLSAKFMFIADVLREANYWAGKEHTEYVGESHVAKAIQEKNYRSSLIEEKIGELIDNGTIMIDADGERVGQINGLAVYDMGEYMFGKPSRLTAKVYAGKDGVVDIERQVKMGGKTHSKGVMILTGFLGERFAQKEPLTLNASICFEQSYDGVDGDSASSTEAYCILSALSGLPLRQDIAVTGSMNQHGDIQPIGGVNEKIEGFYHVCKMRGFTGRQGVMVPSKNIRNLMLKEEVLNAIKNKKFHVYSVDTVDEGIEMLSGRKISEINSLVKKKLTKYANKPKKKKKVK